MSIEINLLYNRLKSDSEITEEAIIKSLIEFHQKDDLKKMRVDGINYYDSANTKIKERKNKELISNHKMANGFYKKIVDQKVSYCVGNEIVINNLPENDLIPDINEFIEDFATETAKKGLEWLYLYLDRSGNIKYKIIGSEECIPIYDTEFEDELQLMIRYYKIEMVSNKKIYSRNKVEVYDNDKVTYYMQDDDLNYIFDTTINANPVFYNSNYNIIMGEEIETESYGWGKIPFIPLRNNIKEVYDLQNIKSHIDMYDIIESDFANNIDQFQDAIMVVVNRGAQSYKEFWEMIKKYKMILVDDISDIGGAHYLKVDIPVEARKEFLQILRDNIFEFAFAVDTKKVGDGNVTNIVIQSRYVDLDLKGNKFIRQLKRFLNEYYGFINIILKSKNLPQINIDNLEYVFNKKMLFNESESIENFVKQGGRISNETLLANHHQIDDVEEELEKIEIEYSQYQETFEKENNNNPQGGDDNVDN